jgi:hypothetical protein
MVEYSCLICNFKTSLKANYTRHLQTNKHKNNEIEREKKSPKKPEKARKSPKKPDKFQKILPAVYNEDLGDKCPYCAKICKKRNQPYHFRNNCKLIPESKRKVFIDKYNSHKGSNKQLVINNNNNNINNSNNVIHNTINNNNNGIINNITVKINPLGKEDLSFLTEKDKLEILMKRYMGVPELIKRIHDNPVNSNFYLPNVNKKILAYINDDNKIEYDHYEDICNKIIDDNKDRFDDFFYELKNKINTKIIDKVKDVVLEHDNNDKINDKYSDDIKFNVMSKSREIKDTIDNYIRDIKEKVRIGIEQD